MSIQRLVLRYGVFVLLVLLSAGILYFVCRFEIRTKCAIHLFHDSHDRYWYGYISGPADFPYEHGDTLSVDMTQEGNICFIVDSLIPETGMLRIKLIQITPTHLMNTYNEGFVFAGKSKIKDRLLQNKYRR